MAYVNFKLDTDADGIALVTWDAPGRSMNVIDLKVMEELGAIVEQVAADAAIKGAVITSGKDTFCAGADLTMLDMLEPRVRRRSRKTQGEEAAIARIFEESRKLSQLYRRLETSGKPWVAAINGTGARRRLRAVPRLPSSRRGRQSEDARRPAGDQDRAVPRRRRHAAHRAHDAAGRRAAVPAQGRPDQARAGQGHEARRRGRAGGRTDRDRQGVDQGRRQGRRTLGRRRLPAARRARLFQGRHDDVPAGERDLPARDLRQLSGRARDHAGGLRRPAAADGPGAAGRVALVRQDPALAGSGGDDPLAVRLDAGAQQGRAPARRTCRRRSSRRSASSARASWARASAMSPRLPASTSC